MPIAAEGGAARPGACRENEPLGGAVSNVKVIRRNISREEVIKFYAGYDRRKKGEHTPSGFENWPWDDPDGLDKKLSQHGLKLGVLAAYKVWWFIELTYEDLLECAIFNGIFPDQPQVLSQLLTLNLIDRWSPDRESEWYSPLQRGQPFPPEWALILRPSVRSECPAKWYIDDGSGRALCLIQRLLRHNEHWRTAYAYLGVTPDERSGFIQEHPKLTSTPGGPVA